MDGSVAWAALAVAASIAILAALIARNNRWSRTARAAKLVTPKGIQHMVETLHPGVQVTSTRVVRIAHCGDGAASTTDRIVVEMCCTSTTGDVYETRAVLKAILLPPWQRLGGQTALRLAARAARLLQPLRLEHLVYMATNLYNFYFPHAPDAMYENEARFYALLRSELTFLQAPRALGAQLDAPNRQWCVLMEDLSARGAHFPTALETLPVRHVAALLQQYAALHGRFWQSPRFGAGGDLTWLPTVRTGGMAEVFALLGHGLIADHVRRHAFERRLLAPLGLSVAELWDGLEACNELLSTAPLTLCHGDAHVQNSFAVPSAGGGEEAGVGFFDFQLSLRASWCRDVSYIIGTALTPEQRRVHEEALLHAYLSALEKAGGGGITPPTFEEAKRLYACGMAWGLVIGWLICPPHNYGPEVLSANVSRLVAACVDLRTFDLLRASRARP